MNELLCNINLMKNNIVYICDFYDNNFKSMVDFEVNRQKKASMIWDEWYENITKKDTIGNEISSKPALYSTLLDNINQFNQNKEKSYDIFNKKIADLDNETYSKMEELVKLLAFSYEYDGIGYSDYVPSCILHLRNNKDGILDLIINVISNLTRKNENPIDAFTKHLLDKCIKIQSNRTYFKSNLQEMNKANEIEDARNRGLRDMIDSDKYKVLDQTQFGISPKKINSGEVDLLIKTDNLPFAFVECLNLESIDKKKIEEHLSKIFDYDTLGVKRNYLIVYYDGNSFADFYAKYVNLLDEKDTLNSYSLIETREIDTNYAEIKGVSTKFEREKNIVEIEHYILFMKKAS